MFTSQFKTVELEDGFSLIEPPAGLLPEINRRIRSYADNEDRITSDVWAGIFVLACLHKNGKPVVIGDSISTLREIFSNTETDEFKKIVTDFLYGITRTDLDRLFQLVDQNSFITKKTTDEVKND